MMFNLGKKAVYDSNMNSRVQLHKLGSVYAESNLNLLRRELTGIFKTYRERETKNGRQISNLEMAVT